jgi:1-phosphofructokinase family hexose kinase
MTKISTNAQPMTASARIVCVALTPAVQRTLTFDHLRTGEVNRAGRVRLSPAGKGVNVALVLKTLGSEALLTGFVGGAGGAFIERELAALGVTSSWTTTQQETRHCHTLIDQATGSVTELVEEAPLPGREAWHELFLKLGDVIDEAACVVLSGALPPKAPADTYARIAQLAEERRAQVFLDSQGEPLKQALARQPFLVKMTAEELGRTFSIAVETEEDLKEGLKRLCDGGAQHALITRGPESAWMYDRNTYTEYRPPVIESVNPIGSGDATTAGILHAHTQGAALTEAVRTGMACGAANALTDRPGLVRPEDVAALAPRVLCVGKGS